MSARTYATVSRTSLSRVSHDLGVGAAAAVGFISGSPTSVCLVCLELQLTSGVLRATPPSRGCPWRLTHAVRRSAAERTSSTPRARAKRRRTHALRAVDLFAATRCSC